MEPEVFKLSPPASTLVIYFLIFAVVFTVVSGIGGVYDWAQRKLSKGPDGDKQENKQD